MTKVKLTKEVVDYAHSRDSYVSVEAELGTVGGQEDDVVADGVIYASPKECLELVSKANVDFLAPALGSVHGLYTGKPKLGYKEMEEIKNTINLPLVLHGGSGIPDQDIEKSISLGTAKINVNTEKQIAFTKAVRENLNNNADIYDPRKVLQPGILAIKKVVNNKVKLFGSDNKS